MTRQDFSDILFENCIGHVKVEATRFSPRDAGRLSKGFPDNSVNFQAGKEPVDKFMSMIFSGWNTRFFICREVKNYFQRKSDK